MDPQMLLNLAGALPEALRPGHSAPPHLGLWAWPALLFSCFFIYLGILFVTSLTHWAPVLFTAHPQHPAWPLECDRIQQIPVGSVNERGRSGWKLSWSATLSSWAH